MKNITEMLNITEGEEHAHSYSVVINTMVSKPAQILEAVESALSQAELYEDDADFDSADVLACAELIVDFNSSNLNRNPCVCFWFDR